MLCIVPLTLHQSFPTCGFFLNLLLSYLHFDGFNSFGDLDVVARHRGPGKDERICPLTSCILQKRTRTFQIRHIFQKSIFIVLEILSVSSTKYVHKNVLSCKTAYVYV